MDVIGPTEAAKLLGVKRQSIENWVASGDLTPVHGLNGNGKRRFLRDQVIQAARKRRARLLRELATIPESG